MCTLTNVLKVRLGNRDRCNQMGREALEGLRVSPKPAASRKINKRIISHPVTCSCALSEARDDGGFLDDRNIFEFLPTQNCTQCTIHRHKSYFTHLRYDCYNYLSSSIWQSVPSIFDKLSENLTSFPDGAVHACSHARAHVHVCTAKTTTGPLWKDWWLVD